MVTRSELEAKIKEKLLFIGDTGTGKTFTAVKVAEHVIKTSGKKVVLIDPEHGSERELELLDDDVLEMIDLKSTTTWTDYLGAVMKNDPCYLKIVDGLSECFELSKGHLEDRFVARGYYTTRDEHTKKIDDKELFILPYTVYSKVYDMLRRMCRSLVQQSSHVICTMHDLGSDREARVRLSEDIYRKFDTIMEMRKTPKDDGGLKYDAVLKKHRGRPFHAFYILEDHITQLKNLFDRRMGVKVDEVSA